MTGIILILVVLLGAVGVALRSGRHGLILHRPYNNQHNDATAARDHRY